MYKRWKKGEWKTPITDAENVFFESFVHEDTLKITVEAKWGKLSKKFIFEFTDYIGYKNILEEYRLKLWEELYRNKTKPDKNWTFIVENSPLIEEMCQQEPLLKDKKSDLCHYVIATEDDVIEIYATKPPQIIELAS